jgi:hypothetical protein
MRVARIARVMNWKLYVGLSLGIVSWNTQQDVQVHTHTTWCGRSTGPRNINNMIIKGIWEIHTLGGASM